MDICIEQRSLLFEVYGDLVDTAEFQLHDSLSLPRAAGGTGQRTLQAHVARRERLVPSCPV
eukprot:301674-Hanusia_phi.AAC.1